jgi:signal transduction histidine kinase/CheY-like chemotaxis protein
LYNRNSSNLTVKLHLCRGGKIMAWTVLIADDCAEDREIYRDYLQDDPHHRYQFIEASSAEQGLQLCQQQLIDVVLLDFQLPDLTGLEFLEELQADQSRQAHPPVIMLTGYGDETVAVQAIKRGAQDYLIKHHLQAEVLRRAIRSAIQQARLQAQLNQSHDRQRLITTVALRIRESLELEEILQTTVAEVQQVLRCDWVQIYRANESVPSPTEPSQCANCSPLPGLPVAQVGDPATCLAASSAPDYLLAPITLTTRSDQGIESTEGTESTTPKTTIWGWLIAHHCSTKRHWQPEETSILTELAVHLAIAIQQAELLTHTQAALVKERELRLLKSKIITTISHEYRTPLSVILASSSLLLKHGQDLAGERQQRCLQHIEDKARHLGRLVDDMLVWERCELDKTRFRPVPIDLPTLIANVVEQQQQIAGEAYQLAFKVRGRSQGFWGDPGLLRLILVNLIDNAVKYSPQGGNIEVGLRHQADQVILTIKDQGLGIPVAEQSGLFQSFSRGSNVETIPGSGLGLSIVKACVDTHGGSIQLQSQVGRGTKVSITFPKTAASAHPLPQVMTGSQIA